MWYNVENVFILRIVGFRDRFSIQNYLLKNKMSIKIALLGFGTVASGVPFLLKENQTKITEAAHDTIEIAKVLVKDDDEKNRLLAAGMTIILLQMLMRF